MARANARARRADDDDDKYAKASSARGVAAASTRAPAFASPPTHRPSAKMFDDDDVAPRSVSARATPARDDGDDGDRRDASARPARLNFDDEGVRGALDRLAFSNSVAQVTDAFSEVLNDASDEVNTYASKAAETLARFQAAQFAMQFNPIESGLSMKPTYVKVPAQTVEELKFWENEDLRALKMKHLEEKQQILAENAGMRALLGDEDFSEAIQGLRETEDGVNRALLLAAVEEITNLKTRVSVLETEAAKQKVSSSGYGGITSMLGGGGSGVDAAQMQKLTRELARLEENNSRMTWMLGEKEKQIKEVRAKYTESAAYALQEKLARVHGGARGGVESSRRTIAVSRTARAVQARTFGRPNRGHPSPGRVEDRAPGAAPNDHEAILRRRGRRVGGRAHILDRLPRRRRKEARAGATVEKLDGLSHDDWPKLTPAVNAGVRAASS